MNKLINNIQNNALAALSQRAPQGVMSAIKTASEKTGVNFAYMMKQAAAESSFNPNAKAKTSSASGLYQFIESTWMSMIEKHGDKYGLQTNNKTRSDILNLRNDPRTASLMAAEFASENKKFLQTHTKGEVGSTELYFAHFLGAGKAAGFLNARAENPMQEAAVLFPKTAKANRSIFYDKNTGKAKSLEEIYSHFNKKFDDRTFATNINVNATQEPTKPSYPPTDLNYAKLNSMNNMNKTSFGHINNYQNLFANPLEIMLLAQMDLPISRKNNEFTLFSMQNLFK